MYIPNSMGHVPGTIEDVRTVSEAFDRWQKARHRLRVLEKRANTDQDSVDVQLGLRPAIEAEQLRDFQEWVVNQYHEWFQMVLVAHRAWVLGHGQRPAYHVYAHWDINSVEPIPPNEDGCIYEVPLLFDMPAEVPGFGKANCLILTKPIGYTFEQWPVPVEHVKRVEGCSVLLPHQVGS